MASFQTQALFLGSLLLLLLLAFPPASAASCSSSLTFASKNGGLYVNDMPLAIKGVNWFGFENTVYGPHGCWTFDTVDACFEYILGFLQTNHFNALRIPLSLEGLATNPVSTTNPYSTAYHDILNKLIDAAAAKGILIMPDLHTLYATQGIAELWYDNTYTMAKIKQIIDDLVTRYSTKWNIVALDLKNEPHGQASWGTGDTTTDWKLAAEEMGNYVISKGVNWLIFVEGVEKNTAGYTSPYGSYWGNNLAGAKNHPISLTNNERLVYSPHVYGPSVFVMDYHPPKATNYPSNLNAVWDDMWGFVKNQTGRAIVLGEWGGEYSENEDDKKYQEQMLTYLTANGMTSNFYWCINPNSGDTGGILKDDWRTGDDAKLNLLARVVPNPTVFTKSGSNICITSTSALVSTPVEAELIQASTRELVVDNSKPPTYTIQSSIDWENPSTKTFGGQLVLTTTTALSSWAISFSFPSGQTISLVEGGEIVSQGPPTKIRNLSSNGNVPANSKVTLSFEGSFSSSSFNAQPLVFAITSSANSQPVIAKSMVFEKNQETPSGPPVAESAARTLSRSLAFLLLAAFFNIFFASLA